MFLFQLPGFCLQQNQETDDDGFIRWSECELQARVNGGTLSSELALWFLFVIFLGSGMICFFHIWTKKNVRF